MKRQQLICIRLRSSCWLMVILCMVCVCFTSGCATYQPPTTYKYYPQGSNYSTPTRYTPSTPQPQPQTIYEPIPSSTNTSATGSRFGTEVKYMTQQERERAINGYLYSQAGWGGTVRDARNKMKASIASADNQLAVLRNKIIVAGGRPETNSNYIVAKAARDNLANKLLGLDNRIMDAIIQKATGDVARRLIWREEDKTAINGAMYNLEHAIDNQNNETQRLLNQANW